MFDYNIYFMKGWAELDTSDIIAVTKKVLHEKERDNRLYGRKMAEAFFEEYGKLECASNSDVFIITLGKMIDHIFLNGVDAALDVVDRVKRDLEEEGTY